MHFALGSLGTESIQVIRSLPATRKWGHVIALADEAGFGGIALAESLYERTLSMPLADMPEELRRFHLTLHLDRPYTLLSEEDVQRIRRILEAALHFAHEYAIKAVLLPPPTLPEGMLPLRGFVRERFMDLLGEFSPKYHWDGISLSVESFAPGGLSVFQGLHDYAQFIESAEGISALINIAEHCCDGYSEKDQLALIASLRVAGFRVSDADTRLPREAATGLPVGEGTVAFRRVLSAYVSAPVACIVSVNAPFEKIKSSLERLRTYVGQEKM